LRPGVAVGVKRHAFYFQPGATLLELGRAVARPNGSQIRKERAFARQRLQNRRRFLVKELQYPRSGFLAAEQYSPVFPVHIVSGQEREIGLRCAPDAKPVDKTPCARHSARGRLSPDVLPI
jgi:hypothetical protein